MTAIKSQSAPRARRRHVTPPLIHLHFQAWKNMCMGCLYDRHVPVVDVCEHLHEKLTQVQCRSGLEHQPVSAVFPFDSIPLINTLKGCISGVTSDWCRTQILPPDWLEHFVEWVGNSLPLSSNERTRSFGPVGEQFSIQQCCFCLHTHTS